MSKAKFAAAKELIAEKKYDEARRILRTIDHPTAREWEAKLNQLDQFVMPSNPPKTVHKKKSKAKTKTGNRRVYNGVRGCLLVVVVVLGIALFATPSKTPTTTNNLATPTTTSRPDVRPTATEPEQVVIIPTVVVNRAGFVTVTPAPGTVYPTATVTDTPIPSATATDAPTSTALPTETPIPQITPVSSDLYDVIGTANARSCPDSKCELIGKFQTGEIVSVVGVISGENYKNSSLWVQAIFHDGQTVYVHSSLVMPHVESVQQPVSPVVRSAPEQQQSFTCPSNCDGARAMGLTAEQAATCPGLDRDHDGQACYGN